MTSGNTPLQPFKKIAQGDMLTGRMYQGFDPGQRQAAQQALLQEIAEQPKARTFFRMPVAPSRASLMAPQLLEQMGNPGASLTDFLNNILRSSTTTPFANR